MNLGILSSLAKSESDVSDLIDWICKGRFNRNCSMLEDRSERDGIPKPKIKLEIDQLSIKWSKVLPPRPGISDSIILVAIERILEDITRNNNQLWWWLRLRLLTQEHKYKDTRGGRRGSTYVDIREPDVLGSVRVEENVVLEVVPVCRQKVGHLKRSLLILPRSEESLTLSRGSCQ